MVQQQKSQQQQGTRAVFRSWLSTVKSMTYTKYSRMNPAEKLVIYKEYGSRQGVAGLKKAQGKVNESGQSDQAQEVTEVSVSKVQVV
jgi:hypothetical protein